MKLLEAGQIVNTHGVRGEVRIVPWCDSAEFLAQFSVLYVDGRALLVAASRVHKSFCLVKFRGVEDVSAAMLLKGKVVSIDREGVQLPEGRHFIQDLIGLSVVQEDGAVVGTLLDVLNLPASDVYVVRDQNDEERLIPVVPDFVLSVEPEKGTIVVRLIEGM